MTAAGRRRAHRIIPGRSRTLLKSNEFIAGRLGSIVRLYVNMAGSSSGGGSSSRGNIKGRLCEQRTRLGPVTQGWTRPRGDFARTHMDTHTHAHIKRSCRAPTHCKGIRFNLNLYFPFTFIGRLHAQLHRRTCGKTGLHLKHTQLALAFAFILLQQHKINEINN